MGWIGTQKLYNTYKECVEHQVLYGKTENDSQWYKGLTQRGNNVYLLGQNKSDNKYWIDVVMCQTTRCHGYSEFQYRGENAIREHFFDVPKKWVALLDQNDKDVQEYIKAREEYEAKKKAEHKPQLGDIFKCQADWDLQWVGITVPKNTDFFVKYTDYYGHKYFMLCDENGHCYSNRLNNRTFKYLKKELANETDD